MCIYCVKLNSIKSCTVSTMFGKLWEWIMGIIAWIMSKFSRKTEGGQIEGGQSEVAPASESVEQHAEESAPAESS